MENLEGKIALVTGASVRLGRALALGLARNGCDLILHCHHSRRQAKELQAEINALGRRAVVLSADLSKSGQTLRLARDAEKVFGRVDIIVNNAALFWPTPLEKLTVQELDIFLQVNLKSPYILSGEIGRRMKRRGWGVIINLACVSAFRPWKTHLPYSISKAGLSALTTGLAKVLAPEVRVNAIAPGPVLPPAGMSPAHFKALKHTLPLRKTGTPTDVAEAALYLCQAPFVTGQILCVDGGRSIL